MLMRVSYALVVRYITEFAVNAFIQVLSVCGTEDTEVIF